MTLEEMPRQMRDVNIDYKVHVETVTRTELITRTTQLPDPSLRFARRIHVNQTPDGPEIVIEELGEYIDNDKRSFERNTREHLLEGLVERNLLSEEAIVKLACATLEVGSKVRMLSDLR